MRITHSARLHRLATIILLLSGFNNVVAATPDIRDQESLEAFLDGVINTSMKEANIAGAVVAVMVDGKVTVKKGYGYSNVENKTPVDPDKTLFRIGSVTKLFTYMSMMQLHEQGKLDLDANIQDYLPNLNIPETFPEPIKVINLFTHTAGFEDRIIGLFGDDEASVVPYAELLSRDLPVRVRKPGLVSSYSNHSLGIAGLIIENISGMSWDDYVQKNILDPLEMTYATASQPVPDSLAEYSSKGYRWIGGEFQAKGFEYVPLGSAGTMSVSAESMMRFMAATLNGGELNGQRVIGEQTLATMQTRLYEVHPSLDAWMYGYAQSTTNDVQTFGHNGGTLQFFTVFLMIPETDSGLFISTNTTGGGKVLGAVMGGLMDRYYPNEPSITPIASPSDISEIVGDYATYRHASTTPGKLNIINAILSVQPGDAGTLKLVGAPSGSQTAIEVEPMVFQLKDKNTKIFFDTDEYGQQRMFIGSSGGSFYKLGAFDSISLHSFLLTLGLVLMFWALIAWPIQRVKSRRQPSIAEHRSRLSFWWFSATTLFVLLGVILNSSEQIVFGLTGAIKFFLYLAYLIPVLGLLSALAVVRLVPDEGTEKRIKLLHVTMGFSALTLSWMFYYWNLIGVW